MNDKSERRWREVLFRRQAEQLVELRQQKKNVKGKALRWWDLALIGTGAVIGAGFFLGTALSIQTAGPSLLLIYILGGATAYLVFNALADMSLHDPQTGSFRVYARKAFGSPAGFISGWMYWLAGILIMSSEVAALSIFTRFWFPQVPLYIFAAFYSILALGINLLGGKDFGRVESIFGLVKTSSLLVFILFGIFFAAGFINPFPGAASNLPLSLSQWLPNGLAGAWSAVIFVFFSYGGIEVMGIMSCELKNPKDIGKAGRVMLVSLTLIYTAALLFVFYLVPQHLINASESPFVSALAIFHFGFADSVLNLLIISAAFSTMVGALFAVTNVMVSLAEDRDAPQALKRRSRKGVALPALGMTGLGLTAAVILSFLLPNTVYEYLTTAAGVMLIMNWIIILTSHIRNSPSYDAQSLEGRYKIPGFPYSSHAAILLILLTIIGAAVAPAQRIGVLVSLGMVAVIFISSQVRTHKHGALTNRLAMVARKKMPEEKQKK